MENPEALGDDSCGIINKMNEQAKKNILRKIPYGLYVIGLRDKGSYHAFTGSWLSQCSMNPPRLMLGVRNGTRSLELIREGGVFSVNLFGKADKKILEQFFKAAPSSASRFGDFQFTVKETNTPILEQAVAYLECRVKNIVEAGDHSIVIGEVAEAEILKDEAPLVMSDTPWHYGG